MDESLWEFEMLDRLLKLQWPVTADEEVTERSDC